MLGDRGIHLSTIGDLLNHGYRIYGACEHVDCGRVWDLSFRKLIDELGRDHPYDLVKDRLLCPRCRRTECGIRINVDEKRWMEHRKRREGIPGMAREAIRVHDTHAALAAAMRSDWWLERGEF